MYSSILASRIQLFLPDLIDQDQTGFVKDVDKHLEILEELSIW